MYYKYKILIVKVLCGIVVIGVLIGGFLYYRYQLKSYQTLNILNYKVAIMDEFLTTTHPDEVKAFIETKKALLNNPAN